MARKRFIVADCPKFFDRFRQESDRACAILARALLEDQLRSLFEATFIEGTSKNDLATLLEGTGPLATFSARIRLAAVLGLLSSEEASDLNHVREIGNEFAHGLDHNMSFEADSVRSRIGALQQPRILIDQSHLADKPLKRSELDEIATKPRRRFEVAVGILFYILSQRTTTAERSVAPVSLIRDLDTKSTSTT